MNGDLQQGWQVIRQRDFTGGENLSLLPEMIKPNQFAKLENAMLSPEGYLTAAFQTDVDSIYSATGLDLKGVVFQQMPSTEQYNYWHTSGSLADMLYSGTYSPTGTAIDTDNDAHTLCTGVDIAGLSMAVSFLGKLYCINASLGIVNLTDSVVITDGNLITKQLIVMRPYMNRLYGITIDGEIIFSNNGDATVWDPLNIILLPAWEKAIDFKPVQGGAIVYSRTSVYAMYGSDYTDISLIRIKENVMLSDGAVELNNTVYICGNRGVYAVTLNGVEEIPHNQNAFFKANYLAWTANETGNIQGIYLYKYHAILYLFRSDVGAQGFMFYIGTGAFYKINTSLFVDYPYMLALEHGSVDFLIYKDASTICTGKAPVGILAANRTTTLKTAALDLGVTRSKVLREFALIFNENIYNTVTINAYLDEDTAPTQLFYGVVTFQPNVVEPGVIEPCVFIKGDNRIWLSLPRFNTIAIEIILTSDTSYTAAFTIKELRLRYRHAGPSI